MSEISAIVVGGVDFAEADRIVHVLSDTGRLAWFAHAARKSRKRFGGALEPFATVRATLEPRRKQGMSVLASLVVDRPRTGIGGALDRIALASYLCELFARVAPDGEDATPIRALLEAALDQLDAGPASRALRRAAELRLLGPLGYQPDTEGCAICGTRAGADTVAFELSRGGVLCAAHGEGAGVIGPKTRAWVAAVLGAPDLGDPTAGLGPSWGETAASKVGRSVDALIRHVADGPLRTLPLLEDMMGA